MKCEMMLHNSIHAHLPKERLWLRKSPTLYILVATCYQGFVYVIYYILLFNTIFCSKYCYSEIKTAHIQLHVHYTLKAKLTILQIQANLKTTCVA